MKKLFSLFILSTFILVLSIRLAFRKLRSGEIIIMRHGLIGNLPK